MTEKKPATTRKTAPKKPQDHKPKGPETIEITLGAGDAKRIVPGRRAIVDGVTIEIPDEAFNDFEILDDFRGAVQNNDATMFPSLLRRLVGDDYRRILNELRDPVTGRVPLQAGIDFVNHIFEALNPNS